MLPILLTIMFITSCQNESEVPIEQIPETIIVIESNLYPEGITYYEADQSFYVSSLTKGKISKVSIDGSITTFADDPSLISTLGMKIDKTTNQLIACISDPGFNSMKSDSTSLAQFAAIAFFDINTGEKINQIRIDTGQPILLNDLTLDSSGNIYITDSFSPNIYKIDEQGDVSTFYTNSIFTPSPNNFGLNGIIYHPDGYLIVSKYDEGKLFKIPINSAASFTEVELNKPVPSIDGLILTDENKIILASNNLGFANHVNAVYELSSGDNWSSAQISNTFESGEDSFPTTFAKVGNDHYVQYAKLHQFFAGNDPIPTEFPITKINF